MKKFDMEPGTPKTPEQEFSKIEFPQDIETVKRMHNKLDDYKQRLESQKSKINLHEAPEQVFKRLADTNYKIAVLEKLLLEGSVDTHQLSLELNKEDGQFDLQAFNNACSVIEDYSTTGGKGLTGGSGF